MLQFVRSDLEEVGNYGLAALFARATLLVATALGRVYFVDIARDNAPGAPVCRTFLVANVACGLVVAVGLATIGPAAMSAIYGSSYEVAGRLLQTLCIGLPFAFCWHALSVINVAQGRPRHSVVISGVGATIGLSGLGVLTPDLGARGVAIAMNGAYVSGAIAGLLLFLRSAGQESSGLKNAQ